MYELAWRSGGGVPAPSARSGPEETSGDDTNGNLVRRCSCRLADSGPKPRVLHREARRRAGQERCSWNAHRGRRPVCVPFLRRGGRCARGPKRRRGTGVRRGLPRVLLPGAAARTHRARWRDNRRRALRVGRSALLRTCYLCWFGGAFAAPPCRTQPPPAAGVVHYGLVLFLFE